MEEAIASLSTVSLNASIICKLESEAPSICSLASGFAKIT